MATPNPQLTRANWRAPKALRGSLQPSALARPPNLPSLRKTWEGKSTNQTLSGKLPTSHRPSWEVCLNATENIQFPNLPTSLPLRGCPSLGRRDKHHIGPWQIPEKRKPFRRRARVDQSTYARF